MTPKTFPVACVFYQFSRKTMRSVAIYLSMGEALYLAAAVPSVIRASWQAAQTGAHPRVVLAISVVVSVLFWPGFLALMILQFFSVLCGFRGAK
jgi:Na+/phosphate symporter